MNFLFSASSSGTPKKLKPQLSHDVGAAGVRVKKGRKTTEEEEGEIVSDPSDSESRRGEKRARRYSSISNPDVEEKTSPIESKEKGVDNIKCIKLLLISLKESGAICIGLDNSLCDVFFVK